MQIVKIRPMAVISPAMIMTAATAKVVVVGAVKTAMTAPMILPRTALNAVILPGMNMELTVQHWKVHTAGIVLAVNAPVMMVAVAVAVTAALAM